MQKPLSTMVLFLIGILLSSSSFSASKDVITLTDKNHVLFSGQVNDQSVADAQIKLGRLSRNLGHGETIYLVIDSPGGSVPAGNLFIDFARSLPQNIKPICIFCASMGYHMFQSFGERLVYSSSELMSHRVAIGGLSGQVPGEAVSRLNSIIRVSQKMDHAVAKRIGISVSDYQALIYDELWLDGDSAVALNHADRIAKIKCSNDLMTGTKSEKVNTLFGPVTVTTSLCPLINGVLNLQYEAGNFRSEDEARNAVRRMKRSVTLTY